MAREYGRWTWRAIRRCRRRGWFLDRRFCTMARFSWPHATSMRGTKPRRWWCVSENNEERIMKIQWILAVVLAMGARILAADAPSGIIVDKENKKITIPSKIAPRK